MEQRGSGDGWILVEILGDAPTVIAEGIKQRQCRPLGNVYRGRMPTLVAGAIDTVKSSGQPVQVTLGETVGDIDLVVGKPVLGPGGDVLAVQIFTGRADSPVPQPHRAAGWEWNLSVSAGPRRTRWTSEFRFLYGVADTRPDHGHFGLADLYRRVPRLSDIAVLMERVDNARDGEFLSANWRSGWWTPISRRPCTRSRGFMRHWSIHSTGTPSNGSPHRWRVCLPRRRAGRSDCCTAKTLPRCGNGSRPAFPVSPVSPSPTGPGPGTRCAHFPSPATVPHPW